ncbi:MAG: acyl-CoA dehydrogenase family protein [Planctomycetes bacterium]|nr:acyl-CoA dehydrogenase family protein [Planctomycetota bacterium]MCB9917243.1 acyl-CoA dehydrogenase family protein [Planctomycetota bacterium]
MTALTGTLVGPGVDFRLDEQLADLQRRAHEFAERELVPNAARWDREASFPRSAIDAAAREGFLRMTIPTEYGGLAASNVANCILLEEINRGCASTGVTVSVHNSLFSSPVAKHGTPEQKAEYLPKMATGEWLGAYCLSEAGAGSDAAALRCAARRDGDDWILDGAKLWITSGSVADCFVVFARTNDHRTRGISAFLVEKSYEGCSVGKKEVKLGLRGSPTTEILLENCRVPGKNMLGEEGTGFKIALDTLDGGRLGIAAQSLGIMRACLEAATKFACEHDAVGSQQRFQWKIADMATALDAARLLTWRAAHLRDIGENCTMQSAMAKSFASRMCNQAARDAVEICGAAGIGGGADVERLMRDARITEIYEGATDIQRLVVARGVMA